MPPKNLKLNYRKPIVAVDGQTLFISDAGPINLIFFQIREEKPQEVNADVVAAVRFHTLDELKNVEKLISETIKQHESREK